MQQADAVPGIVILHDGRMTAANAARYLGYSEAALANMRLAGTGPKFIKPGRIFYYRADLDEWLAQMGRHCSLAEARKAAGKAA